jgi:hypothetical protein
MPLSDCEAARKEQWLGSGDPIEIGHAAEFVPSSLGDQHGEFTQHVEPTSPADTTPT